MYLPATLILGSPHDDGIGDAAALSGRLTYLTMCLTLCWGVLAATGWVRRGTGHQALRTGHVVLASFTLALGAMHMAWGSGFLTSPRSLHRKADMRVGQPAAGTESPAAAGRE